MEVIYRAKNGVEFNNEEECKAFEIKLDEQEKKHDEYLKGCKYLTDLGIPLKDCWINWIEKDDERWVSRWNKQIEEYGFCDVETWNFDSLFIDWLYCHLMMYKDTNCVNLDYHKFEFEEKEYSQKTAIDFILDALKEYIIFNHEDKVDIKRESELFENVQKAIRLFAEILGAMWW